MTPPFLFAVNALGSFLGNLLLNSNVPDVINHFVANIWKKKQKYVRIAL